MPFVNLSVTNFRNLADDTIDLSHREVFFVGENGQGKSNLLEALYCTAYGASFRTKSDGDIIRHGDNEFSVRAFFRQESGATDSVAVYLSDGKKRIEKNMKKIADRKELINTIPCVLFCHDDLEFVTGEPERRRFFLDQSLSMYDIVYLDVLRRYKKVLKSRNTLLREQQIDMAEVYDQHLAEYGLEICRKRKKAVYQFNRIFGKLYEEVTGIDGLFISYEPSWKETASHLPELDDILAILRAKHDIDCNLCTTMSGPHRDRIRFLRNGKPFIPDSSTGQRRLIAILLRVAQAVFYTEAAEKKPVLLMDDVLLELDPDKRQRVTAALPDYDQLFCTFLPGEPYERYKKTSTKVYTMENGCWHE